MKKIQVENYRSIKDSGMIELRPITIAVGRNSVGKSSFIRVFPLLKQTLEKKTADPILWYGDYVDFGDFRHTVTKTSGKSGIKISFEIETMPSRYYYWIDSVQTKKALTVKVSLSVQEQYCDNISIWFEDQKIEMRFDINHKVKVVINDDTTIFDGQEILAINQTGDIIPSLFQKEEDEKIWTSLKSQDLINKCNKYIFGNRRNSDRRWRMMSNNIAVGSREEILAELKRLNKERFKDKKITHKRFLKYNNYIIAINLPAIIERINYAVQIDMQRTSYIKPIRARVDRYYRVQGVSIDEVDADGSNLPMILKNMSSAQLNEFEKWSKEKFGIVFSAITSEGHISLIIKDDIDSSDKTNVADTGYGYSQMLPIVMLLWMIHKNIASRRDVINRTVVIEQPELHLHPAYQAKMMDVFVNIIKEAKKNGVDLHIILETHSETMINRLGMLVAYGKISKDDINILVFDKQHSDTTIESKGYDDDGILRGWPGDFFAPEGIE